MNKRKILDPVVRSKKHAEIREAVFNLKNNKKAIDAAAKRIVMELTQNGDSNKK